MTPRKSDEKFLDLVADLGAQVLPLFRKPIPQDHIDKLFTRLDAEKPFLRELDAKEMQALLLRLLAEPMTGFEIALRLEKANIRLEEGGEGVLYGLLSKLETAGRLKGEWRERGDQMIKRYRVTEKGEKSLRSLKVEAAQLNVLFDLVRSPL